MRNAKIVVRNNAWAVVDKDGNVILESPDIGCCERFLDLETLPPIKPTKSESMFFSGENDDSYRLVGHLRFDFGRSGKEFWSTWFPRNTDTPKGNKPEVFRKEFNDFMDLMRERVLKSKGSASSFCWRHNIPEIHAATLSSKGFVMESKHYEFYVRICLEDYCYIHCYDKGCVQ